MSAFLLLALFADSVIVADDPHPESVTLADNAALGPAGTPLYLNLGVLCGDPCREEWPPLEAPAGAKALGEWQPRNGQWTYKQHAVHAYKGDRRGGKAKGDGRKDLWQAIHFIGATPQVSVPPNAKVGRVGAAFVLADHQGHTLYRRAGGDTSPCAAECLEQWPPLLAPALALPVGQWQPINRPDGIRQWSYRGALVYRFSEDALPGDAKGSDMGWEPARVTAADATRAALGAAGAR